MQSNRILEIILDAIHLGSLLFIAYYAYIRKFASEGSSLQQGYVGTLNLSNIFVGTLIILVVSAVTLKLAVKKPLVLTNIVKIVGLVSICLIFAYFVFEGAVILYGLLTGHLLDGWEF